MPRIRIGVVKTPVGKKIFKAAKSNIGHHAVPHPRATATAHKSQAAPMPMKSNAHPAASSDDWWKHRAAESAKKHAPLPQIKKHKSSLFHGSARSHEGY